MNIWNIYDNIQFLQQQGVRKLGEVKRYCGFWQILRNSNCIKVDCKKCGREKAWISHKIMKNFK